MYQAQNIPASLAHATLKHPQQPLPGDDSLLLQLQRQRLPTHV